MTNDLTDIFSQANKLKTVLRFLDNPKMEQKESSADHAWRTAFMAMALLQETGLKLDESKVLKMALVHNLFQIYSKNVDYVSVAQGKVDLKDKDMREEQAMEVIKSWKPETISEIIYNLINEYKEGQTTEAKFVRAVSKLETLDYLVNCGYESYDTPQLIWDYADRAVAEVPELQVVLDQIKNRLKVEFAKGGINI